jgi:tetratricopeptide (TPR) repeat protein
MRSGRCIRWWWSNMPAGRRLGAADLFYGILPGLRHRVMRKKLFLFLAGGLAGYSAYSQLDSSPLKDATIRAATSRYAGGVDKEKVMDMFEDQQFDEALAYLSPVLQADSDNVAVLSYAGYAYYVQDNFAAATACYERMLTVDSNSITGLHYLVLLLENSNPNAALRGASRLLSLQPGKATWWRTVGELWRRKQRSDSALAYLSRAYALAPGDMKTVAALAGVLVDGGAFGQADSLLDLGLQKDSMNVSLLKLRVQSAYQGKHYEEALVPGERLLGLNEPAVNALEWLALSYYDLKRYPESIRVCEAILDMGLELEAVYYYESRAQAKVLNFAASDSLLRKALNKAINKTAEWYYDDLGDNYEAQHEYRRALAHYDTAYFLFHEPLALYTCGRICETELHNTAPARKYFLRYLAVAKPVTDEEKKVYNFVRRRFAASQRKPER